MFSKGSKLRANISSTLEKNKGTRSVTEEDDIYEDTAQTHTQANATNSTDKTYHDDYIDVEVEGKLCNSFFNL